MNKRRILYCFLILAFCIASPTFAQNPSFLFQTSFGLFDTPLDAATSVQERGLQHTFSSLTQPYFFGSLTNYSALPTGAPSITPFTLGLYQPGKSPWSLVAGGIVSTTQGGVLDGVGPGTIVLAPVKTVGTTDYTWIQQSDNITYTFHDAWDVTATGQVLTRSGSANVGASLNVRFQQNANGLPINTWTSNNVSVTRTYSYDAAGAGVAPAVTQNYTMTSSRAEPDAYFQASLSIPLYVDLGSSGLRLVPSGAFQYVDTSFVNNESLTAPAQAGAGTFTNVTTVDSLDRKGGNAGGAVTGTLFLAPLVKGHVRNTLQAGLQAGVSYNFSEPLVQTVVVQDFSYAGNGAALQVTNLGSTASGTSTVTYAGALAYHLLPSVEHTLYFDLTNGATLAFGPSLEIAVDTQSSAYRTQAVAVTRTDNTSDGLYTSTADRITTTTITYANNNNQTLTLEPRFTLPAAVTYHPANFPLGLTVGASATAAYTATIVTTPTETGTVGTHVVDGQGNLVGTDTVMTALPALVQRSFSSAWSFTTELRLCVSYYLPNDGTIDIIIKGALPGDRVEVQAVIPLP